MQVIHYQSMFQMNILKMDALECQVHCQVTES